MNLLEQLKSKKMAKVDQKMGIHIRILIDKRDTSNINRGSVELRLIANKDVTLVKPRQVKFKDLTLFPKLQQKIFELENVCDNIFLYFYDYSDTENKYILKTDDVGYSNIIIKLEENLYHSLLNLQI